MAEFERAMAGLSMATQCHVNGMKAATPETWHCYIEELVVRVYREAFGEGAAFEHGSVTPELEQRVNERLAL